MTDQEIFNVFTKMLEIKFRVDPADPETFDIGPFSVWKEDDGKWTIGRNWSTYCNDSGWDGGCDPVLESEGSGPLKPLKFDTFQSALRSAAKMAFEDRLTEAGYEIHEQEVYEMETVEEVHDV